MAWFGNNELSVVKQANEALQQRETSLKQELEAAKWALVNNKTPLQPRTRSARR